MKTLLYLTSIAACAGALRAAPSGAITTDPNVVARVGDTDVKLEEIRASLAKLDAGEQAALAKDPALLNQVVRLILVQRIMLKEAQEKKWEEQPKVKEQIERAKQTAIAESYLQSISEPPENYPSEGELKAFYEAGKASLAMPRQYRLAQVFVACGKDAGKAATEKALAKLDAVKKKVSAESADFSAVAKTESDEQGSAGQGGEIGWLTEAQIQPEIRPQVTKLVLGEVSSPVRLDDGWHILKCLDIREPFTPALDQVRSQLIAQMRTARAKANSQAYIAKLLQQHPLAINEIALARALPDSSK